MIEFPCIGFYYSLLESRSGTHLDRHQIRPDSACFLCLEGIRPRSGILYRDLPTLVGRHPVDRCSRLHHSAQAVSDGKSDGAPRLDARRARDHLQINPMLRRIVRKQYIIAGVHFLGASADAESVAPLRHFSIVQ